MKKKIALIVAGVLAGIGLVTLICVAVDSIFFIKEREATISYFTTSGKMTKTPKSEDSMPILVYDNDGEEATIIPGLDVGNAYTPWFISILTHNIIDEELVNTRSIISENIMDKRRRIK